MGSQVLRSAIACCAATTGVSHSVPRVRRFNNAGILSRARNVRPRAAACGIEEIQHQDSAFFVSPEERRRTRDASFCSDICTNMR